MEFTEPSSVPAIDLNGSRQAFWIELLRIASKGADLPTNLPHDEIRRVCRFVLVGMARREVRAPEQSGLPA